MPGKAGNKWEREDEMSPRISKSWMVEDIDVLEVNSLMTYRGNVYASLGPHGEIWKYNGEEWKKDHEYKETSWGNNWHATWWAWTVFNNDLYIGGFAPGLDPDPEGIIEKFDGKSWTHMEPKICGEIFSLDVHDGYIYGGSNKLIRSDDGSSWESYDSPPDASTIKAIQHFTGDGNLYIGTVDHIYRYDVADKAWTDVTPQKFQKGGFGLTQIANRQDVQLLIALGRVTTDGWYAILGASADGSTWNTMRVGKGSVSKRWGTGDCFPWVPREPDGNASAQYIYIPTGRRRGNGAKTYQGSGELWATDLKEQKCVMQVPYGISSMCEYKGHLLIGTAWHPIGDTEDKGTKYGRWSTVIRQTPDLRKASHIPLHHTLWNSKSIDAGDETEEVIVGGYEKKTIHVYSDTEGTFTIKADPVGSGTFREYDSIDIPAGGGYNWYTMTGNTARLKISFDSAATVTVRVILGG